MRGLILVISVLMLWSHSGEGARNRRSNFELGRQQFEKGRYARALSLFDQAIKKAPSRKAKNKAYYFQGLVLYELGYFYSSYLSFRNVLKAADRSNRKVYEKSIKNAVIIMDRLGMAERVGKTINRLPPDLIPSSVNHMAHYAQGVYFFKTGKYDSASSHLKSVHPKSQFYNRAIFRLGVLSTKKKKYRDAIFYFKKVIKNSRRRADYKLRELAKLNLARSVYSAGDMERSIQLYSNFTSKSPYWLTILLEASWPLMRVSDTTVSLGNLHTLMSPFYREDLVGEAYILRTTILFALCKYEEMRITLSQFFEIYDPVLRAMQSERDSLKSASRFYDAYAVKKSLNRSFTSTIDRDPGIQNRLKALSRLAKERTSLAKFSGNLQLRKMRKTIAQTIAASSRDIGSTLKGMHKRKLNELVLQREQANYLKVEIVTGEKDLIESQKGLPPKRVTDVETTVAENYQFWPFHGEYWEDELGSYVYTTESACIN